MRRLSLVIAGSLMAVLLYASPGQTAGDQGVPAKLDQLQGSINTVSQIVGTMSQAVSRIDLGVQHLDPSVVGNVTLYSSFLLGHPGLAMNCSTVNVTSNPISVNTTVFTVSGAVAGSITSTIGPREQGGNVFPNASEGYCRFMFTGAPNDVRASAALQDIVNFSGFTLTSEAR
jgi:hypothetical protein